ncbi:MAG TPA: DNA internalization-related competence protein ComEC/Rec2 [Syntrophales bacterium]|nr:DNA internalization-related competence protein ComEC/Rec2 [Syntrophales bacterium]
MNILHTLRKTAETVRQEPVFLTERPLIPFFISFAGGIALCDRIMLSWLVPAALLLPFLTALLFAVRRNRYTLAFVLLQLIVFSAGMLSMAPYSKPPPVGGHPPARGSPEKAVYRGFIDESPSRSPDRIEYTLSGIRSLETASGKTLPGRVLLTAYGPETLRYGDYVQFRTRLAAPKNFNNPGGFDYRRYLIRKDILYRGYVSEPPDLILIRRGLGHPAKMGIESYRTRLRDFISRHTSRPEREIILAMILGEQKAIPDDLKERFNQTGTSHIIAISGFNVGLIACFSVLLFLSAMKIFPRLLLAWNAAKLSLALSLIPILLFTGIAGMGIPVIRATLMVVILLTAILIRKPKDILNALALAAVVILALAPPSLFDPSFQLSFAAVAAILYIPQKLEPLWPKPEEAAASRLRSITRKWGRGFFLFLLVTVSATLGTQPVIAYHFQRLSTVVIPANIAVVPFLGILTTPLCLLIIITYPLCEPLCLLLLQGAVQSTKISVFFVNLFSSIPGSSFLVSPPNPIEITEYYLLLSLLVLFLASLVKKRPGTSWIQTRSPAEIGLWLLGPFMACILLYGYLSAPPSKYLRMTAIDVGQGSCTLLQIPGNRTMLVDGGGFEGSTFDVGRHVVAPFLLREKIRKIDVVVLTHPHPDHLNGLIYILRNFSVGEIWTNGEPAPYEAYRNLTELIRNRKLTHRILYEGKSVKKIGALHIDVLNPPPPVTEGRAVDYTSVNDRSLVLRLRFGKIRLLLPGDIMGHAEERLAASTHDLKSDILLAPHHGGKTSSTDSFLDKVDPRLAIISCGLDNRYKDPHPEVLQRYTRRGTKIFRTDRNGAVVLLTDGTCIRHGKEEFPTP